MRRAALALAAAVACVAAAPAPSPSPIPPNIANITLLTDAAKQLGAVCLDGSPAAYYVRPGAETRKFYIHQQGGGWCNSDADCFSRSLTRLGSSKGYAPSINLGEGYFSNDPAINPMMANWTVIFLPYCDGGSQTGDLADPVPINSTVSIFYRGHRILKAIQSALLATEGLAAATDVVISGCSAGGLATYLHADEWAALLPRAKVAAMPDSGFFLDYNSPTMPYTYHAQLTWLFGRMNSTGGVPAACRAANPGNESRCIFAEHVAPTLKTPFFPLQSEYDSWQIGNDLHVPSGDAADINSYGKRLTGLVQSQLLAANAAHGVFLDSCYHHCGEWGAIEIDGQNQAAAFSAWYASLGTAGAKKAWIQGQTYPCDACCKA